MSIFGTEAYLTLPEGHEAPASLLLLVERGIHVGQLWRFERMSDDSGGSHQLQPLPPPYSQPNPIVSGNSARSYIDDAHFHTDMLFNMPRSPFTRTQRAAALEWARKLGAANVPTLESFDQCERRMGTGQDGLLDGNNLPRNL
ncbi:hypothetical protein BDV93DRAFT_326650 [Ceratobasidium sp. AG-I]|nr:hypothetical protein BDV93DRAFT_326650 [Ceratobasidium sp. AG-I]